MIKIVCVSTRPKIFRPVSRNTLIILLQRTCHAIGHTATESTAPLSYAMNAAHKLWVSYSHRHWLCHYHIGLVYNCHFNLKNMHMWIKKGSVGVEHGGGGGSINVFQRGPKGPIGSSRWACSLGPHCIVPLICKH